MKKLFLVIAGLLISLYVFAQKYYEPENLNGNWTFYRNQLITDYNLYIENETVSVPDIFYKNSKGYGTFLRRLYYLEPNTKYAVIMFESPGSNAAAFVNREFVSSCGTVTITPRNNVCCKPWIFEVITDEYGTATIAIQISNWVNYKAGMWSTVFFGKYEQMMRLFYFRSAASSIAVGMLFFLFVVSIFLFIINHKKEHLFFSIISLLLTFRVMTADFNILLYLFPEMNFEIAKKMEYSLIWCGPPVYFLLIGELYPEKNFVTKENYIVAFLSLCVGFIGLFIPFEKSSLMEVIYITFSILVPSEVILHLIAKRKVMKQKYSVNVNILFIGMGLLIFGVSFDWIMFLLHVPVRYSPAPICFMFFAVLQFLVISYLQTNLLRKIVDKSEEQMLLNRVYHKFVPNEFFTLLGKFNVTQINIGDHIETDLAICFLVFQADESIEETYRKFSELAEKVIPPVSAHKGFISKFIDNGIMILFRDPVEALKCCIELKEIATECGIDDIGIGLHYGKMIVGAIGEKNRLDDTVISDTVNSSYRIMQYSRKNKYSIVASSQIVHRILGLGSNIEFTKLGEILVKGRKKSLLLYSCKKADVSYVKGEDYEN